MELDSEILSVFEKKKKGEVSFFSSFFFFRERERERESGEGEGGGKGFLVGTLSNFLRLQELSSPG